MTYKQGDTYPTLRATLTDAAGAAVDLTDATVVLRMVNSAGINVIDDAAVLITNATAGEVEYQWTELDTATPGVFRAEFHAEIFGGGLVSFPNDSYIIIEILPALAEAVAV